MKMPVRFRCRSEERKLVILKAFEEMENGRGKKVSFPSLILSVVLLEGKTLAYWIVFRWH